MDSRKALLVVQIMRIFLLGMLIDMALILTLVSRKKRRIDDDESSSYSLKDRIPDKIKYLDKLTRKLERYCVSQLRMGRDALGRLCFILREAGGLTDSQEVTVLEQVCIFIRVLSHHKKNSTEEVDYERSSRTMSKYFHNVLTALLKLHQLFVVKPTPIEANSNDSTWKWFEGCLGALDGTLIEVTVSDSDKGQYRSRKGKCHVNVLGVCDRRCNFICLLTGWEGSVADGHVLRDAVHRPNGLRVPKGNYYLCDAGYTNGPGFLAPYRGTRYHLQEWGDRVPVNEKELFNRRHSSARTTTERAWGILKKRWAILRSPSFYDIKVQNKIIMVCALLHNFIRREMSVDPVELELTAKDLAAEANGPCAEYIPNVEPSQAWTDYRDQLASDMWDAYRTRCVAPRA